MRLLKITATGLPLFKDSCEIDFMAMQRISRDNAEQMSCLFSVKQQSYYQNNVMSFIGINASGKTSILKLIAFICGVLNNSSINSNSCNEVLDGVSENERLTFDVYFHACNDTINLLHTVIVKENGKFRIIEESLKAKPVEKLKNKADVFNFDRCEIVMERRQDEAFLLDDISIMVAFNKKHRDTLRFTDTLPYTNNNHLSITEAYSPNLIAFFDPGIEYLRISHKAPPRQADAEIQLKFFGRNEIVLNRIEELNRYLSSGTIKGINTFARAMETFRTGGYLIVDEIENHFNREIVSTLIRFYMDPHVNPKGAMLIFSTHYAELLDEFERNDNIYVVRNRNGITVENLSAILKRNDIKKSEAYQSGYLDGTVPAYDAYITLKKSLVSLACSGEER